MQVFLIHFAKNYLKWVVIFVHLNISIVNAFSDEVDCHYESCYYIDKSYRTWQDAETLCQNQSGHLIEITDKFEQTFLEYRLRYQTGTFWLGLNNKRIKDTLTWNNDQPITYSKWDIGQPVLDIDKIKESNRDVCIVITTGPLSGFWQVQNCSSVAFSVCEVSWELIKEKQKGTVAPDGCGETWTKSSSYCYKIFDSLPLTWKDARQYCLKSGGDLVSLQSSEEEANVINLLGYFSEDKWIGLSILNENSTHHVWSDGSAVIHQNWYKDEPNNHNGLELCVALSRPKDEEINRPMWYDRNCDLKKPFICKMKEGIVPSVVDDDTKPTPQDGLCESSWSYFNDSCYLYKGTYLTWQKAREACRQNNSELVSIGSEEELELVFKLLPRSERVWIGFNKLYSEDFGWSNGEPITFKNWGANEPNNAFHGEKCVAIMTESGTWFDINCGLETSYVCKRSTDSSKLLPEIKKFTEKCPAGWFESEHRCYKIFWKPEHCKNWIDALQFCRAMGSGHDLASIKDQFEEDTLIVKMKDYKVKMWIGKVYNGLEFSWNYWTDNSDGTFQYWDFGQPRYQEPSYGRGYPYHYGSRHYSGPIIDQDEDEQNGNCTLLRSFGHHAGKWSSHNCSDVLPFICGRIRGSQAINPTYEDTEPHQKETECPFDYTPYGDSCYKLLLTPKTWVDADAECKKESATLASINNVFENTFARILTKKQNVTAWIGLSNHKNKQRFDWSNGHPILFTQWITEWSSDFVSYSKLDPDICVLLDNLDENNPGWRKANCKKPNPYICKQYKGPPLIPPLPSIGECPVDDTDWIDTGANCFLVKIKQSVTWGTASAECKTRGYELASFDSEIEYDYVKKYINEITSDYIWIGLYKLTTGDFVWSDKSEVSLQVWNENYPSNYSLFNQDDSCVVIDAMGTWRNVFCRHRIGYVCKLSKSKISVTKTPQQSTDKPVTLTTSPDKKTTGKLPAPKNNSASPLYIKKEDDGLSVGSIFGICLGVLVSLVVVGLVVLGYQKRHRLPNFMENPRTFMQTLCHSSDDDITGLPDNMEHPR